MNIFALDLDVQTAASYHIDKHVVKMVTEYAQLLSTAHRVLDGKPQIFQISQAEFETYKANGVRIKKFRKEQLLDGEEVFINTDTSSKDFGWQIANKKCMRMSHMNHPSGVWCRSSSSNYEWLYNLFIALCEEKSIRYPTGSNETFAKYAEFLKTPPKNIPVGPRTLLLPAVGSLVYPAPKTDEDIVEIYRRFYVRDKLPFAKWKHSNIPAWFIDKIKSEWSDKTQELKEIFSSDKLKRKTDIKPQHVSQLLEA